MRSAPFYALVSLLIFISALLVRDRARFKVLELQWEAARRPTVVGPLKASAEKVNARLVPLKRPETHDPSAPLPATKPEIALESALENWIGRIDFLKAWIKRRPELQTPELKLLKNDTWLFVTVGNPLTTEKELTRAVRILNEAAITLRNSLLIESRARYFEQNGGPPAPGMPFPTFEQTLPYIAAPFDEELLRRAVPPATSPP